METAVAVGLSCGLLNQEMDQIVLEFPESNSSTTINSSSSYSELISNNITHDNFVGTKLLIS